ncbi:MAG: transposase domain-containing protein [Planctomycetota bacterium]
MSHIGSDLAHLERHVGNVSVEALSGQLDPRWIPEILTETGTGSKRVRKLPADVVVRLTISMAPSPPSTSGRA